MWVAEWLRFSAWVGVRLPTKCYVAPTYKNPDPYGTTKTWPD